MIFYFVEIEGTSQLLKMPVSFRKKMGETERFLPLFLGEIKDWKCSRRRERQSIHHNLFFQERGML